MNQDEESTESLSTNEAEKENLDVTTGEEDNGVSRFSEDGMETEIEVTPGEENTTARKKKKRKKTKDNSAQNEAFEKEEEEETMNGDVEAAVMSEITKPVISKGIEADQSGQEKKKEQIKTKFKKIRKNRCYPLYLFVICKICVIIPIAIYACDVIIGVNVLENADLGLDLVAHPENLFNDSKTAPLLTLADHPYHHKIRDTVLSSVQLLSKVRSRRQADSNTSTESTTEIMDTTKPVSETGKTTEKIPPNPLTTVPIEATKLPNTTEVTFPSVGETTESDITNGTFAPTVLQFCETDRYFVQEHEILSSMTKNKKEKEYDWYNNMNNLLYRYQQALFFMFTVIGFIFLLTSIGMRVDAVLNEKWSSSLLVIFLLYSISLSLTAKVFALQSGSDGVRCFLCQMVSFCKDIDPWGLTAGVYFPVGVLETVQYMEEQGELGNLKQMGQLEGLENLSTGALNWNTAAFVSVILKFYDCFAIGIVTLTYVVDWKNDLGWIIFLKIVGWVVAFPIMVVTPLAGVMRYSVLPVTIPEDYQAKLAFEIIFYIGVAFWAISLVVLPFFCKTRMCNQADEYEEEEEYY